MAPKQPTTYVGPFPKRSHYMIEAYGLSDVGSVRELNEDCMLLRQGLLLWAVADGMGGHARGDLASQTVIEYLRRVGAWDDPRNLLKDVVSQLEEANTTLREEAGRQGEVAIGSTAVCMLVLNEHGLVVWAGDSRAYRLRGGKIEQLSIDHSVVQELVEAGVLAPEDAESHPHAHILTRAVGAADQLDLDFKHFSIKPGDFFILCTDGLSRCVEDREIANIAWRQPVPELVCRRLISAALDRGAKDNVTVVAIRVGDPID